MKRVLFLGSKPIGYRCLEYLLNNQSDIGAEVVGVLSNDNTRFDKSLSVSVLAQEHEVSFYKELDEILKLRDVDFIFSVQYHKILKEEHILVAKELAVNLHMAPLPEYRGCNQFSFAIYNNAKEFGTTLHRLEMGIDNGDIIAERRFPMTGTEMVNELYQKTYEESILLFQENVAQIVSGDIKMTSQKTLIEQRGTHLYYRKQIKDLKHIDLESTSDEIVRKVRATAMPGFEPPFALVDGKKYYLIPEANYENKKE